MIIQNEPVGDDELADLSFTVERSDLTTATDTVAGLGGVSQGVRTDERIGKVSIVGAGMRSHPGVAAKVFEVLGGEGINIEMISTSPIRISCVIDADRVPDAVRALHDAFELGEDAIRPEDPTGAEHRPTAYRHSSGELQSRGARRDRSRRLDDPRDPRRAGLPRLRGGAVRLRALGRQASRVERLDAASAGR